MVSDFVGFVLESIAGLLDVSAFSCSALAWKKRRDIRIEALEFAASNPELFPPGAWSLVAYRTAAVFQKIRRGAPRDAWGLIAFAPDALNLWLFASDGGDMQQTTIDRNDLHLAFGVKEPLELFEGGWIEVRSKTDHFYVSLRRGFKTPDGGASMGSMRKLATSLYGTDRVDDIG